ncbi:hypothetical protein C5167_050085 [Papaver somniferum]|uniref:Uncharacterized protein n=1 Tax=Papaver somniferum TaxID=3469 RepID=A0A4Y7KMM4_PAPSO|nr:hypothetical protein C5167_050085 [Papaver somniferum]
MFATDHKGKFRGARCISALHVPWQVMESSGDSVQMEGKVEMEDLMMYRLRLLFEKDWSWSAKEERNMKNWLETLDRLDNMSKGRKSFASSFSQENEDSNNNLNNTDIGSDSGFSRGGLEGSDYVILNNVSTQCEDGREVTDLRGRGREEGVAKNAAKNGVKRGFFKNSTYEKGSSSKNVDSMNSEYTNIVKTWYKPQDNS